jgi:quercetin dioxygenase-like cupin family protein
VVYVAEGEYVVEVGPDRFRLHPGDSAFGPRGVPRAWSFVGDRSGRIIFSLSPAGRREAFFRALGQINAMAPQDPAFWPPLAVD